MTKYQCPVCSKRACDSEKSLSLAKLTPSNETQADVIIKCQCCKSTLAVNVAQNTVVIENVSPLGRKIQ
ncbi:MAG: hypothetical protein IKB75_06580 [Clostridia bacterium]|nr:hypothetical protein [Clostridia bacterium]